jgi:hypothetical protein
MLVCCRSGRPAATFSLWWPVFRRVPFGVYSFRFRSGLATNRVRAIALKKQSVAQLLLETALHAQETQEKTISRSGRKKTHNYR